MGIIICDVCGARSDNRSHPFIGKHPFWGYTCCVKHKHDNTTSCCSCRRFQGRGGNFVDVGDGRKLCPNCLSVSIMDPQEIESLVFSMCHFFNDILNINFEAQVPVLLVDIDQMRQWPTQANQTYSSVGKFIRFRDAQNITTVIKCEQIRGDEIEVVKKVVKRGTAVMILHGLPMVVTASIMAHEMMHVWIYQQGWRNCLEKKVKEGICELISHMWLEQFASNDQFTMRLRDYRIFVMENGYKGKDYGDGYKEAKKAVDEYGLETTLKHLAETGSFNPAPQTNQEAKKAMDKYGLETTLLLGLALAFFSFGLCFRS